MNTINVKIDISTPNGRKLLQELQEQKGVEIENPLQSSEEKIYNVDEVFDKLLNKLKRHYEAKEQNYEEI